MRVYLDNCCYNRPFDDQAQVKVLLETIAKLDIQQKMRDGAYTHARCESCGILRRRLTWR